MEFGSGVGLVGTIASLYARKVICTDKGEEILDLCQVNIKKNQELLKEFKYTLVKEIDWEGKIN